MLWYKGWLETRFNVFALITVACLFSWGGPPAGQDLIGVAGFLLAMIPVNLAGSGIKTQSALIRKGPVSTYFTLSLPVSRFRLFATRAGLGLLETVGIFAIAPCGIWILFSRPEDHVSRSDLFAIWVSMSVCASACYFLGVLLSTLLDEPVVGQISLFAVWVFSALLSTDPRLAPVNIFRAMLSPLFTHSLPWASMGISLGVAAALGWTALRVMETREY